MSSWARPGVKCVCVDATNEPGYGWKYDPPVEGKTYTVIGTVPDKNRPGGMCLLFEEIKNGPFGYSIGRFRPLVPPRTQEQDVAIFTPLLTTTPVREPV